MNNYDLSKVESEKPKSESTSPYLTYGSGQVLKINNIELKISHNTNAPKAILHMETKPINDPTFTPVEGAVGRVGRIGCGPYMNSEPLKREFLQKMKTIAATLGLEDQVNQIKSDKFEQVVEKISNLLKNRYARYTIVAAEYPKSDGKVGITLSLPRFKFVESENADPSTIVIFDKTNQYHYKKMTAPTQSEFGAGLNYVGSMLPLDSADIYKTPLNLDNPPEEKLGKQEEDFLDLPF